MAQNVLLCPSQNFPIIVYKETTILFAVNLEFLIMWISSFSFPYHLGSNHTSLNLNVIWLGFSFSWAWWLLHIESNFPSSFPLLETFRNGQKKIIHPMQMGQVTLCHMTLQNSLFQSLKNTNWEYVLVSIFKLCMAVFVLILEGLLNLFPHGAAVQDGGCEHGNVGGAVQ